MENVKTQIFNALIGTKSSKFKANLKDAFKANNVWFRFVDSKIDDGVDGDETEDKYVMMDAYDVIIGSVEFNKTFYVRMYYGDVSDEISYVDVEFVGSKSPSCFENYNEKSALAIQAEKDRTKALCGIVEWLQEFFFPQTYIEFDVDNMPDFWDNTREEWDKIVFAKVEDGELKIVVDSQNYDEKDMDTYFFRWSDYGTIDFEDFVYRLKCMAESIKR